MFRNCSLWFACIISSPCDLIVWYCVCVTEDSTTESDHCLSHWSCSAGWLSGLGSQHGHLLTTLMLHLQRKKNWVLIVQCDLLSRCLTYTKNLTAYISQLLMHIIWYSLLLSDQQKRRVFIGWNEVLCLPVARYSLCMLKVPLNTKQTNKQYTVLHYAENCSVID